MEPIKDTDDFNEYMDQNPRKGIPCDEMKQFLVYAKSRYADWGVVNHTHCDDEDETKEETESYIHESMEALLLYKEWKEAKE